MLAVLAQIAQDAPDTNIRVGDAQARRARAALASLPATAPPADRWQLLVALGQAELRLGNEAEAIAQLTRAHETVAGADAPIDLSPWVYTSLFHLGVAQMQVGDTENCTRRPSPEGCILPLGDDGVYREQGSTRQAIATFTEALGIIPEENPLHLTVRWLLNIAYMQVGGYPEAVPDPYMVAPRAFESEETIPRFDNVAPRLGLDTFDLAGGAIADDFDNDGYLDLVVSTSDPTGQLRFFRNTQDGAFLERTEQAGLVGLYGGLNLIQADYDNDDDIDIYVLRGAWLAEHGQHPNSLLRNNGDGTFSDVTFDVGLGQVHYPTQTAAWADYDNDGDLDLYVGNESSSALRAPSQLFRNDGDGTFTDVAVAAGVQHVGFTKGVVWGDYDGDRWADLYVSNRGGANRLYRNNGDGTFTDVAGPLGVDGPRNSFPAWFWDVDNDGVLDLYVSAYAAGPEHLAAHALGLPVDIELAALYRGTGEGGFDDVGDRYGVNRPSAPMGANFGDLDNDGYLDFYLGTGYPQLHHVMPSLMYRSRNGERFVDVTFAGGFGHLQKGHAVVFADLDHDGDQDVFEQMGGAFPIDRFTNALYDNPGFGNHWITVSLVGARSNRSAIGARIRAEVIDEGARRSIYRHVNSGGSFGANPLRQTIGLGKASRIETLEVYWPVTGETQQFDDVPVDRVIRIVEDEPAYSAVPVGTFSLGGR
jgi:tetratricopeptide (TPR) repeat protein